MREPQKAGRAVLWGAGAGEAAMLECYMMSASCGRSFGYDMAICSELFAALRGAN